MDTHRPPLRPGATASDGRAAGIRRRNSVAEMVDTSHEVENRLRSLTPGFTPQVQVGNNFSDAFKRLLKSMLDHQYPDHPRFDMEVKLGPLRTVLAEVQRAVEKTDGRIEVAAEHRAAMRKIATPLELGTPARSRVRAERQVEDPPGQGLSAGRRGRG